MTIKVNGREYEVKEQMDMTKLPNVAKYLKAIYHIEGKKGAAYSLNFRVNGSSYMQSAWTPETTEVRSYQEVA